jgi:hypothetical protein
MSATFSFYVVDDKKFPTQLENLSDQEKYKKLVEIATSQGSSWALLELDQSDFEKALDRIDSQLGAVRFLRMAVFNNSPHHLLSNESDCPFFGYLDPSQVKDLHARLERMPADWIENLLESEDEVTKEVLYAFQSSAEEADKKRHSLAVIHS